MQIAIIKDNKVDNYRRTQRAISKCFFSFFSGPPADWMTENSVMPVYDESFLRSVEQKSIQRRSIHRRQALYIYIK